jgi:DNA mismatch repair protein MutS
MDIEKKESSPLMQQYEAIKAEYSDALLFFQVGDFYELFYDDAKTAATFLGIALTARGKNKGEPIPLCGVPVHTRDHYIAKLVKGGFKVAICDQLEEPKPGSVVKRGVTQLLTPGTLVESTLLNEKSASYLFSFVPLETSWGLVFGELLTAQLFATVLPADSAKQLEAELSRFFPDEILIPQSPAAKQLQQNFKQLGYFTTIMQAPEDTDSIRALIKRKFHRDTHDKISTDQALKEALYNLFAYLKRTQASSLEQFSSIQFYEPDDFLLLDVATQRNLELVKNNHDGTSAHTLFSVLDMATTSMGSRMLKKWLLRPLIKREMINHRHEVIATFIAHITLMQQIQKGLRGIGDVERIIGRIALNRAHLHDYHALRESLEQLPQLRELLHPHKHALLFASICQYLGDFTALCDLLERALHTDTPEEQGIAKGEWIIKDGFDAKLDRMRSLVQNAHKNILDLEAREQASTGINSLKIRYTNVHGYYIEITNTHLDRVPAHYKRQQTLVGRERYITPELQNLQHELITARNEIDAVEKTLFEEVKAQVFEQITPLRKAAHALAHLDVLLSLASIAYERGYVRPTWNDARTITISQGRHPVIEHNLDGRFIPNDTMLTDSESLWIITGPNMGGKSTYLRQVALISIMAQIGSYVPAKAACVPILDRIFTRIGAGDNLAQGKSTFLVEMEETALICQQATEYSLVILDEVGRGTSTFDGLAIAQAVVEYIHTQIKARCLFATHYHELTHLQDYLPGIASYYAASSTSRNGIVLLHQIVKGVADGSFGVEVAKRAELPRAVIQRAEHILQTLKVSEDNQSAALARSMHGAVRDQETDAILGEQLTALRTENKQLLQAYKEAQRTVTTLEQILDPFRDINYDNLSPKQAFDLLWRLKDMPNNNQFE